jgi:hypothetical protein
LEKHSSRSYARLLFCFWGVEVYEDLAIETLLFVRRLRLVLKANPRAICAIGGKVGEYMAHEASGEEYERFWQCALDTYIGYPNYKQRVDERHIPIMVMTPVAQ